MADHSSGSHDKYYVPAPSAWPITVTIGLFLVVFGVGHWLENASPIPVMYPMVIGSILVLTTAFRWFRGVALESESGAYNNQVDHTYRWAMTWFIYSEVMFFGAFFGALFYTHVLSVPWLGGSGYRLFTNLVLWPHFTGAWPTNGPDHLGGHFEAMEAFGIAAINTVLLVTSSFTITIAHHKLKSSKRGACIAWMLVTITLGLAFLGCQAYEFFHAYTVQHMTLHTGVYGSTFFMLTGFHGLHVTLGTIMMIVITLRLMFGHFSPDHHFGFEGVSWYWHFVDVIWILLFTFVYIL